MSDVNATLAQREKTHGSFEVHANITQRLKRVLEDSPNWAGLPDVHKEALGMILHKIARLCCGDHMHLDSAHDIAGYARLIETFIEAQQ